MITESLENKVLRVEILGPGTIRVINLFNGRVWEEYNLGQITLAKDKTIIKASLLKAQSIEKKDGIIKIYFDSMWSETAGKIKFEMETSLTLDKESLILEVSKIIMPPDWKLVGIEYPFHLFLIKSGSENGYLVIPFKQGVIVPSKLNAGFMRFMHNTWQTISDIERVLPFESGSINMPWFGTVVNNSGLFGYIETPDDCSLHIICNSVINDKGVVVDARQGQNPGQRISSLSPVWISSKGNLSYPRRLRIELISGGYVDMTKRYLSYSKRIGRYVSLKDKIEKNPLVEKVIGAPDIKIYVYTNRLNNPYLRAWSGPILDGYSKLHTTFRQVSEMALEAKRLNIEKCLFILAGWSYAGYDRKHIDIWPPAEVAGGETGLKEASEIITKEGYLLALHDNYQDFYTDAPSYDEYYLMKDENGSIRLGGIWDGGLCHLICSSQALQFAKRNLDLIMRATKINSYYLDTTTATCLWECYDKNHPVSRSEDKQNKLELLKFLSGQGLVVGSEGGTDWAIPICSFFEGLPGSSEGFYSGIESMGFGIIAPLFNLVYHDAIVCYWQHGQPFGREDHSNHVLHDLLCGQPSSWSLVYEQWEDLKPLILQCYKLLADFHKKTAYHPMISHEFLTPDFAVQRTRFGDGSEVTVNFGITSHVIDKIKIPPKGFILKTYGESVKLGTINRSINYILILNKEERK